MEKFSREGGRRLVGQRNSGYPLKPGETYITPQWVWDELKACFPQFIFSLDPCPPEYTVDWKEAITNNPSANVATNPPFTKGEAIARHCHEIKRPCALLLPVAWDCAKGRIDICRELSSKLILTRRILWDNLPHTASPSSNHAWYIWMPGNHKARMLWV